MQSKVSFLSEILEWLFFRHLEMSTYHNPKQIKMCPDIVCLLVLLSTYCCFLIIIAIGTYKCKKLFVLYLPLFIRSDWKIIWYIKYIYIYGKPALLKSIGVVWMEFFLVVDLSRGELERSQQCLAGNFSFKPLEKGR